MHNTTANEYEADREDIETVEEEIESELDENGDDLNDESKQNRFKKGQPLTFIRVRFPGNAKSFPFLAGKRIFSYGQKVMAMSDRGMTVGYINSFPYEVAFEESMMPVRSIARIATAEDIQEQQDNFAKERKSEELCIRLIEKHELNMNVTHVEFIQFGKKAVFYFVAPERVDFRGLVKDLVGELKMRIELRQISVRDRAAAIGAVGACGLQTCCSSFLKGYGSVSIKMAKNQNLALIPSKINGVCGQIKCCIKYEDKVYSDKRKQLPIEGSFVETVSGDRGKVTKLHIIIEQFEMLTDTGYRRRYTRDQFDEEIQPPKDWSFPDKLPHVIDETSNVVGINKEDPLEEDHFYWYHNTTHDEADGEASEEEENDEIAIELSENEETDQINQLELAYKSENRDARTDSNSYSSGENNNRNNRNNRNRRNNRPRPDNRNGDRNFNKNEARNDQENREGQDRNSNNRDKRKRNNRNRRRKPNNSSNGNQGNKPTS